jgi:hypothetical protein
MACFALLRSILFAAKQGKIKALDKPLFKLKYGLLRIASHCFIMQHIIRCEARGNRHHFFFVFFLDKL